MKLAVWLVLSAAILVGCPGNSPQGKPETVCFDDCMAHASKHCDDAACVRGCRFILDRLVEHEGHNVVACVASAAACDDPVWADCAAKIGPHADGGPPEPSAPKVDDDNSGFGSGE
ncbi:MAG: hypothetical protein ABI461_22790 [Polyangiaceae bacterium]